MSQEGFPKRCTWLRRRRQWAYAWTLRLHKWTPKNQSKNEKKIILSVSQSCLIYNAVKISLLRVSRLPSGQWFNHFWKNRREILMRCPICWALACNNGLAFRSFAQLSKHGCHTESTSRQSPHCIATWIWCHRFGIFKSSFMENMCDQTLNMQHCWTNMAALDSNQNIDSKFKFTAIDAW